MISNLLTKSTMTSEAYEYFTDSSNTINIKSDVVLIVEEEKFFCHRLLLSLVSPVFTRMFDSKFKEHNSYEIKLEGKTSQSIFELLKYIYPQFNGQITNDNVEDFLLLADEYMIDHIKQPCRNVLLKQLNDFKFVLLPTQCKLEKPSMKSKSFHASDSALNSPDDSLIHNNTVRIYSARRPISSFRHHTVKSSSSAYFKSNEKNQSSSNNHSRYVLFLDKTQIPHFYTTDHTRIAFSSNDIELWLRRLRILYQIDKGGYYGEVIEYVLSILQFIPAALLCPLIHVTIDTYSINETMLNDIARARMYMLEDWASDGDPYRQVNLTDSYQAITKGYSTTVIQHSTNKNNDTQDSHVETIFRSLNFDENQSSSQFTIASLN